MRFAVPLLRSFRWYTPLVCLLALGSVDSARAQAGVTTLTGTVLAPQSVNNPNPDPLPNVLVYVAPPGVPVPDINHGGNGISGGCAAQTDLVGLTPVVFTTTDYKGSFTLASPALTALGSGTFDIVIQAGKWRRQFPNTQITAGATNNLGNLNMPSDSTQGDLPKIAVVTGSVDAIECVLRQMGIADTEVTDSRGAGHINLYAGTKSAGAISSATSVDSEQTLMTTNSSAPGNPPLINNYDLVMFGCQGNYQDATASDPTGQANLRQYADNGGRVFATHFGFVWLNKPATFAGAANWRADSATQIEPLGNNGIGIITVNTSPSFTEGTVLANWLQLIGASPPGTAGYGQLPDVQNTREDQTGIISPTQSWGTLNPPYTGTGVIGTPIMQFSFDTPIAATGAATVSLAFTNTPTKFFEGDPADTVAINVTNTSTIDASNLTLTLVLPTGLTAISLQPTNAGSGWVCNTSSLTCSRPTLSLNAGASDPITLTVAVAATGPVGNASISATLSGVSLTGANKCGRVLFNEYHVEQPVGSNNRTVFPAECSSGNFTPPEKFLEFSLYNLSNFVAPTTTDQILIQGAAVITWNPPATVYYGTPSNDPIINNATSNIPGTFITTADVPDVVPVGKHTVTLTFTPTDTTDYITSTQTAQVTWVADPTVSTIDSLDTSIFYGQEIGFNNGVDAVLDVKVLTPPGYPIGITAGLYTLTIDGKDVCHGIEGQPLNPPSGRCDDADFLGWNAGDHKLILTYAGDGVDFLPSVSSTYVVHISPDPTVTTLASSVNPSLNLQPITFTANVADVYAAPVGPATFYDSTSPNAACAEPATPCNFIATKIGSAPVVNNAATLVLTTLFKGTHYVSACFTPPLNSDGVISNFFVSCSASVEQVVVLGPATPLPTQTFLTSSINPSLVSQAVTFTATTKTSGAFTYTPTGTVAFYDGTTLLNTATVNASGIATFTTSALALGSHPITAMYSGNTLLAGRTSAILTQVVTTPFDQAGTGYLLLVDTTTAQVPIGSIGTVQVQIIELNNFNQPVHLTCTGLPAQSTCTFVTPDIPATGGTTQLFITAAAPHDCNGSAPYFVTPSALPLFGLATLTLCLVRRRRKLQGLALLIMLCLAPALLTGCGSSNCTDFGVKPNNYNFTITATSQGTPQVVKYQNMKMRAYISGE